MNSSEDQGRPSPSALTEGSARGESQTPRTDARCTDSQKLKTMAMRFAWMCDHARTLEREVEMLAKCHRDNCASVEQLAKELSDARKETEFLRDALSGFEWHRINAMSRAEVEKELLDAGYTRERLDAGLAKIRAIVAAAIAKSSPNKKDDTDGRSP